MPIPGRPDVLTPVEFAVWMHAHGRPMTGQAYWDYRAGKGVPVPGAPVTPKPAIPTPPLPDSLTALLTQREALPDLYNPQRHTIAAGGAAQLEGLGYADPGTTRIDQATATDTAGNPGRDIRYFVFRGADGTLYRQAYLSTQNQGAQKGSLYTSGTADQQAADKQKLDYNRQNILTGVDTGQTNSLNAESGAFTGLTGQYQTGLEQYNANAPATVNNLAPPPPTPAPKPPAVPKAAAPKPPVVPHSWVARKPVKAKPAPPPVWAT